MEEVLGTYRIKLAKKHLRHWSIWLSVLATLSVLYIQSLILINVHVIKLYFAVAFEELIHCSRSAGQPAAPQDGIKQLQKSYSYEDIAEEKETGRLVLKEPTSPG